MDVGRATLMLPRWLTVRPTINWRDALLHALSFSAALTLGLQAAGASDLSALGLPGTWYLRESRAGSLCESRVDFYVDAVDAKEGRVRYRSPCTDSSVGVWRIVIDGSKPTMGWALEYEKSRVLYSTLQVRAEPSSRSTRSSFHHDEYVDARPGFSG